MMDRVALHLRGTSSRVAVFPTIGNAERRGVARSTLKAYRSGELFLSTFCDHNRIRAKARSCRPLGGPVRHGARLGH